MKVHTIESAASAVRGLLRSFSDGDRVQVISLATRAIDDDLAIDERNNIDAALAAAGGNVGRAAAVLRCSRRTLQNRMRRLGMPPGRDGRPAKERVDGDGVLR